MTNLPTQIDKPQCRNTSECVCKTGSLQSVGVGLTSCTGVLSLRKKCLTNLTIMKLLLLSAICVFVASGAGAETEDTTDQTVRQKNDLDELVGSHVLFIFSNVTDLNYNSHFDYME